MYGLPYLDAGELHGTLLNALRTAADVYCRSAADLAIPPRLREQFARQEREALDLADKLEDQAQEVEPIGGLER